VDNGVIHLVDRPLAVTAGDFWDFLSDQQNAADAGAFLRALKRYGGALEDIIK